MSLRRHQSLGLTFDVTFVICSSAVEHKVLLLLLLLLLFVALSLGPTFDVPLINVTVVLSQSALLPCSIDYLGKYKVIIIDIFLC